MRRLHWLLLLTLLLAFPFPAQAQTQVAIIAPNVFLRGLQLSDGVRYTASLVKPSEGATFRNVSVEITLPAEAFFIEMTVDQQVQFDVIRINSQNQLTLIWQISRVEGDAPLAPFSFKLARPLANEVEFYIEWTTDDGLIIVENFYEVPPVSLADQATGQAALSDAQYSPIGTTGVQAAIDPANAPLIVDAHLLAGDFNPPAEYGDIWWCSILELFGSPVAAPMRVIVPLRLPIAPFTALQLFHQQADGTWLPLAEQGVVTADGQFVMYTHPGGVVASGGESKLAPEIQVNPALGTQQPEDSGPPPDVELKDDIPAGVGDPNAAPPPPAEEGNKDDAIINELQQQQQVNTDPNAPPPDPNAAPPILGVVSEEDRERLENPEPEVPRPERDQNTAPTNPDQNNTDIQGRDDNNGSVQPADPNDINNRPQNNGSVQPTDPNDVNNRPQGNPFVQSDDPNTQTFSFSSEQPVGISLTPQEETPPQTGNDTTANGNNTTNGNNTVSNSGTESSNPSNSGNNSTTTTNDGDNTGTDSTDAAPPPANQPQNNALVVNPTPDESDPAPLLPFGSGGVRIEIFLTVDAVQQCQVGQINCVNLNRRFGAGFR
jgi:hypothetical protein